jgi:DNA repair protein RadC
VDRTKSNVSRRKAIPFFSQLQVPPFDFSSGQSLVIASIILPLSGRYVSLLNHTIMDSQFTSIFKVSEVSLSYKNVVPPSQRVKINGSVRACELLLETWSENTIELKEEFKILLLNRAHKVLGISVISSGGVSGTLVDPKMIFVTALKANSSGLILSHNHPSGNLQPSQADIQLTRKLVASGKLLELPIIDHIILTTNGYFSFADEGLI